jgi:hypothetical protein
VTLRGQSGAVMSASADGVLYISCDYLRVQGLKIAGPGTVGGTLVYFASSADHVDFIANEVTGSVCQGLYAEDTTSFLNIQRNWIHDNGKPACDRQAHGIYIEASDSLVANNVIHDHPEGFGIQHYPDGSRTRILNNTIANTAHGGIVVGGSGGVSSCVVANNITTHAGTYGVDSDSTRPSGCSIHHNLGFANGDGNVDPALSSGNSVSGNLSGDPRYVNHAGRDLRLQAGSPAVNAGDADSTVSPAFDGVGRPLGAGPDLGAYER